MSCFNEMIGFTYEKSPVVSLNYAVFIASVGMAIACLLFITISSVIYQVSKYYAQSQSDVLSFSLTLVNASRSADELSVVSGQLKDAEGHRKTQQLLNQFQAKSNSLIIALNHLESAGFGGLHSLSGKSYALKMLSYQLINHYQQSGTIGADDVNQPYLVLQSISADLSRLSVTVPMHAEQTQQAVRSKHKQRSMVVSAAFLCCLFVALICCVISKRRRKVACSRVDTDELNQNEKVKL